jgi:hypothetical protein
MNVGPAASILDASNPYHHTAPHRSPTNFASGAPTSNIGIMTITGMNSTARCMNLVAVRIGSHILSHNNCMIRERMDCRGSEGEDIKLRLGEDSELEQGIKVGDAKKAGAWGEGCGRR